MYTHARFLDRGAKRENRRRIAFRAILFPFVSTSADSWQYFIEVGVLCSAEKHAVDLDGVELVPPAAAARKQNARGAAFRDDGACGPPSSGDRCGGHASGHRRAAAATGAGGAGEGGEGAGREGATATGDGESRDEGAPPGRGREVAQAGRGQGSRRRSTKGRLLRGHCASGSTGINRDNVSFLFATRILDDVLLTSFFRPPPPPGVSTLERARQSRLPTAASALENLQVVASRHQPPRETTAGGRPLAQLPAQGGAERWPVQLLDVSAAVVVHARHQGEERRGGGTTAQVVAEQERAGRGPREGSPRAGSSAESSVPVARSQELGDSEERG